MKKELITFYLKNMEIIDKFNELLEKDLIVDHETLDEIGDTHHRYMIMLRKILEDNGVKL